MSKSTEFRALGGPDVSELVERAVKLVEEMSGELDIDRLKVVRRALYSLSLVNLNKGVVIGRREQLAVPCVRCGFSVPPQNGSDP